MNGERIMSIALIVAAAGLLLWAVIGFTQGSVRASGTGSPEDYARMVADELPDKCATPEGYTDAEWQEHMGHHPDQYAECFSGQ